MTDEFDRMLWAYRAVFKQTDVGGGTVIANIVARERMVLLFGTIGRNDYAANRGVTVYLKDEDDNIIAVLLFESAVDNVLLSFPRVDQSAATADDGPDLKNRLVLGKGDYLQCFVASVVQNEELTVTIRALVSSALPSITTTGSAGTVTTTEAYNKVI